MNSKRVKAGNQGRGLGTLLLTLLMPLRSLQNGRIDGLTHATTTLNHKHINLVTNTSRRGQNTCQNSTVMNIVLNKVTRSLYSLQ